MPFFIALEIEVQAQCIVGYSVLHISIQCIKIHTYFSIDTIIVITI